MGIEVTLPTEVVATEADDSILINNAARSALSNSPRVSAPLLISSFLMSPVFMAMTFSRISTTFSAVVGVVEWSSQRRSWPLTPEKKADTWGTNPRHRKATMNNNMLSAWMCQDERREESDDWSEEPSSYNSQQL